MVTRKDLTIVGGFLLTLSTLFIILAFTGYFYKLKVKHEFAVIIDIDSDYVEFNLYKWENYKSKKQTADVHKVSTHFCNVNANNPNLLTATFKQEIFECFKKMNSEISNFELANATIFIYGTEYNRIFCKTYPDVCTRVFQAVADVSNQFGLIPDPKNQRTLGPTEEPLFGWISVNGYFKKLLKKQELRFATVDVKNYSVLVAFDVANAPDAPGVAPAGTTAITVFGNDYNVYTADYSCFGIKQSLKAFQLMLILRNIKSNIIHNPCMANDASMTLITSDLWNFCVTDPGDKTFLPKYIFQGNYNANECSTLVKSTLDSIDAKSTVKLATLRDVLTPLKTQFYAFSELTVLSEYLKLKINATLVDFKNSFPMLCGVSPTVNAFSNRCFDLVYSHLLLTGGFGLNESNVIIGNKSESIETLTGSMIYNSIKIPPRTPTTFLSPIGFSSVLFTALTFLTFFLFIIFRAEAVLKT